MFDRIRLWWKFDGRYMHKEFARGIKNLWRWLPVIWKDRDWDQVYIYTILAKKLEFQAKYIGDNDIHTQAKRDAEIMRTCIRLIERQQEDYYTMEYIDHHHTEHEFIPVEEVGGYTVEGGSEFYEIKSTMISENFDAYFAKYPRQYKLAKMGHLNRFKRELDPRENKKIAAMEIACENQERSRRLLFKILEQNIDRWWD